MLMLQNGFAMVKATSQYVNSNLILFLIVVILYNKEMSDQDEILSGILGKYPLPTSSD